MKKLIACVSLSMVMASVAVAQTVIAKPDPICGFFQPVTPGDTTLPTSYTYFLHLDTIPKQAISPTCTAPVAPETRWRCEYACPLLPTGTHSIAYSASVTVGGTTYETPKSTVLTALSVLILTPQEPYTRDKDVPVASPLKGAVKPPAPVKKPGGRGGR